MTNFSLKYPLLTLVILTAAAGCGGSEAVNSENNPFAFDAAGYDNQGGAAGAGYGGVTGNPGGGAAGLAPPGPNCGNGALNAGESCDGPVLGGATCASATMGSKPLGVVACLSNCTFDVSACRGNGPGGGSGGGGGGGGALGSGGGP